MDRLDVIETRTFTIIVAMAVLLMYVITEEIVFILFFLFFLCVWHGSIMRERKDKEERCHN